MIEEYNDYYILSYQMCILIAEFTGITWGRFQTSDGFPAEGLSTFCFARIYQIVSHGNICKYGIWGFANIFFC
jgi:hypothetical protein